uniref:Transporter n=1 Tax=Gasterosteus aculeatus aculeatus TaxID=481459 RepID=A0AAQ4RKM1_GASAC
MGKANDPGMEGRPEWDNKVQYLLTCIGFAVGIGNVWRFPYLCQIYGGGAFLIPYLIALVFEGLPLLYLEMAIGQRLRMGSIGVWNSISPLLGGVGGRPSTIGYNAECVKSTPANYFWYRETLNISTDIGTSGSLQWWLVVCLASAWCVVYVCFIKGIESIGKVVYVTAIFPYLVLTIFLVRALTLPGATAGLVYLFTPDWEVLKNPQVWLDAATQIFFSLSVAFGGLIAFSSYNKERNNCELDAVLVGVINSATSLYGAIPIFAILGFKANSAYNSCMKENILALTNHFEFSDQNMTAESYDHWLEYLNRTSPSEVASLDLRPCELQTFLDQSASGTGLAFIVFSEAVVEMPGAQIWAILFFTMLFSLGLSSMFGNLEGVLTPIRDLQLLPVWIPNALVTAVTCLMAFSMALIFTMASGNYWVEIFNSYVGSVPLLIVAFFEIIAVIYVYGMKNFSEDIYFMTGKKPNLFWKVCWRVISPLMLLVVLIAYVVTRIQERPSYGTWNPAYELFPKTEVKPYPDWVFAIIILLSAVPVIPIPLVALYHLIKRSSARADLNPSSNEGFEIEPRDQQNPRAPQVESRH